MNQRLDAKKVCITAFLEKAKHCANNNEKCKNKRFTSHRWGNNNFSVPKTAESNLKTPAGFMSFHMDMPGLFWKSICTHFHTCLLPMFFVFPNVPYFLCSLNLAKQFNKPAGK